MEQVVVTMSALFGKIVNAVHQIFLKGIYAEGVKIQERYFLIPSRIWDLIVQSVDGEAGMMAKDINIFPVQTVKLGNEVESDIDLLRQDNGGEKE